MLSNLFRQIPFIFCLLLLVGCQDIVECIINREAQLQDKSLKSADTNYYYYETISAEVRNSPSDNNYSYYFSISDDLPQGLDIYVDYRTIIIEGYPKTSGDFTISVYLTVEYDYSYDCESEWNDCDHLCDDDTTMDYILTVF